MVFSLLSIFYYASLLHRWFGTFLTFFVVAHCFLYIFRTIHWWVQAFVAVLRLSLYINLSCIIASSPHTCTPHWFDSRQFFMALSEGTPISAIKLCLCLQFKSIIHFSDLDWFDWLWKKHSGLYFRRRWTVVANKTFGLETVYRPLLSVWYIEVDLCNSAMHLGRGAEADIASAASPNFPFPRSQFSNVKPPHNRKLKRT